MAFYETDPDATGVEGAAEGGEANPDLISTPPADGGGEVTYTE